MGIDFNDLGSLSNPNSNTGAMELDINLIDEDPNQPRTIFDDDTLLELAETIKERGVKSPISVHRIDNGRYMVNHGARRLRASKLAGKTTIPAFIDDDYNQTDQIIENIQRDNLKPMEIAKFIKAEKERGLNQKQIAEELGKGAKWVSDIFGLLSLYPAVLEFFEQDRIDNYVTASELNRLYKQDKDKVESFLEELENDEIVTRKDVRQLAKVIKDSNAFEVYSAVKDSIVSDVHIDDDSLPEELNDGTESSEEEITEKKEEAKEQETTENENIADTANSDLVIDLSEAGANSFETLDELDSEPGEDISFGKVFKTVKEIRCNCDAFGTVTVVFKEAKTEGNIVVLTDDGVKEVKAEELKIKEIVY